MSTLPLASFPLSLLCMCLTAYRRVRWLNRYMTTGQSVPANRTLQKATEGRTPESTRSDLTTLGIWKTHARTTPFATSVYCSSNSSAPLTPCKTINVHKGPSRIKTATVRPLVKPRDERRSPSAAMLVRRLWAQITFYLPQRQTIALTQTASFGMRWENPSAIIGKQKMTWNFVATWQLNLTHAEKQHITGPWYNCSKRVCF